MEYRLTKDVQKESIKVLRDLIAIPSVLDEGKSAEGMPFGPEIRRCLDCMIAHCDKLGMRTFIDENGYYGYAEVGEGEELLVILCHLDVVPSGDRKDWKVNPFELTLADDKIYGRGTQDDKGPTVAALFALKALMDQGVQFNRRIRFVFGTDEENLWRCLDRYNQVEETATLGFAPDADFPLVYAEKGLLQAYITGPGSSNFKLEINNALNIVPDKAEYKGDKLSDIEVSLKDLNVDYDKLGDSLIVKGKAVHAKNAPDGVNAIVQLVEALGQHYNHPVLNFINDCLSDPTGKSLFGIVKEDVSGTLTMNLASLKVSEDASRIGLDFRIPVKTDKEDIVAELKEACQDYGLEYEEFDYLASLYVPQDSELVETLLGVYRELTGDDSEPLTSGGATFARTVNNCVAFGARTADVPVTFHQNNENIPVKNYYEAMEIYAHAIKALATQDNNKTEESEN